MSQSPCLGRIFNIQKFSLNDGPGIRTVVFFKGCPLRCAWCANPESQEPQMQVLWDAGKCLRCNACVRNCPSGAIRETEGRIAIDRKRCPDAACTGHGSPACVPIDRCPGHALKAEGEWMSVEEVMQVAMQDEPFYEESGGGVTLSGGEALMQPEFAVALLEALKARGVHTAMETTGFAAPEVFRQVARRIDLLLFDIKHWDEERHKEGTGVSNCPILQNMKYAIQEGKEVLPRLPVIPGYNDSPADAEGFARRLEEAGADRVQLLPFHPFGENKYAMLGRAYAYAGIPALPSEELEAFRQAFFSRGVEAFF